MFSSLFFFVFCLECNLQPIPPVQIKDEPIDAEDDFSSTKQTEDMMMEEMVDPTMFLERTAAEGDEPLMVNSRISDNFGFAENT